MWPSVASAFVAIVCLATVLEATYLERPLWVAEKGKPLSVAFVNEELSSRQAQAERQDTEHRWLIPEPLNPSRSGAESLTRTENLREWPSQNPSNSEQKVREERPVVVDSFQGNQPFEGKLPNGEYLTYNPLQLEQQNQEFFFGQGAVNEHQVLQSTQQQQQIEYQRPSYYSQQSALEHSKPLPTNVFGQQSWNLAPTPEDSLKQYQNQEQLQTKPDKNQETLHSAAIPFNGQPSVQLYQPKPDVFVTSQQKPTQSDLIRPGTILAYQAQRTQEAQQSYNSYQKLPEAYKPSPSLAEPDYQIPYLLPSQPLFQPSQPSQPSQSRPENFKLNHPKPALLKPADIRPEGEISYQAQRPQEVQQSHNVYQPRPEVSPLFSVPNYHIAANPKPQYQPDQSKPERFVPNQQHFEPMLSKPSEQQAALQRPEREMLYQVERPQESQHSYNPYPARPEIDKPTVNFPEPGFQNPYMSQLASQPSKPIPEPEYPLRNWGQMPTNGKPIAQSTKPEQEAPQERKPQLGYQSEQGSPTNTDYYQYQPPALYPYQSLTDGPQVFLPTGQDVRERDNLSSYQTPSKPSYPIRKPVTPKPQMNQGTQVHPIRQPNAQSSINQPQRPVRPVEREQEQLQYQPNRSPPTSWESQYQPEQSIPNQQKPAPIAKPPQRLPNISQQPPAHTHSPETYYEDDEDEELVKYEMTVTRSDPRCPRDDDPAKPVHFPSGSSCVKFQKCFNGIAYEMSCPPGLQFDAKHSRCDYPARANCAL